MLPYVIGFITFIVAVIVYFKVIKKTSVFSNKDNALVEIEKDVEHLNKMVSNIIGD